MSPEEERRELARKFRELVGDLSPEDWELYRHFRNEGYGRNKDYSAEDIFVRGEYFTRHPSAGENDFNDFLINYQKASKVDEILRKEGPLARALREERRLTPEQLNKRYISRAA